MNESEIPKSIGSIIYQYQKKYHKAWQERHKNEIDEKNREKVKCEICNKELASHSFRAHLKTKKHLKNRPENQKI